MNDKTYSAKINAVNSHFNTIKYGLPLLIVGSPAIIAVAGQYAIAALGVISVGAIVNAWKGTGDEWKRIDRDQRRQSAIAPTPPAPSTQPTATAIAPWQPTEFKRDELLSSATGILLAGNSGSGKTTLAQFIAQGIPTAPILVLDPHHNPDDNQWGSATVVKDKDQILLCMKHLLKCLDEGDRRPLVVIADEYPSIRLYAKHLKSNVATEFILRVGSEGRKYNKLSIFGSQSGNVKSYGLEGEGDFLENFTIIRLGKIATKHAANRPNRDRYHWLNSQAYAISIDGSDAMLHPNLGHHAKVLKGAAPVGLDAIAPPPLPEDIAQALGINTENNTSTPTPTTPPNPTKNQGSTPPPTPINTENNTACCDAPNIVKHSPTSAGTPRRRCTNCGKTWTIKSHDPQPIVWGV